MSGCCRSSAACEGLGALACRWLSVTQRRCYPEGTTCLREDLGQTLLWTVMATIFIHRPPSSPTAAAPASRPRMCMCLHQHTHTPPLLMGRAHTHSHVHTHTHNHLVQHTRARTNWPKCVLGTHVPPGCFRDLFYFCCCYVGDFSG